MAGRKPVGGDAKPKKRMRLTHQESEALRHLGETLFVMDPDGISTSDLATMAEFSNVHHETIRTWAVEGDWMQKRRDKMQRWRAKLEDRLGEKIVRQRVQALQDMEKLYKQTMAYVSGGDDGVVAVQPKSFEGTVATAIKIEKHMAELRREMLSVAGSAVDGRGPERSAPADNLPQLSQADMQAMAHSLMVANNPEATQKTLPEPQIIEASKAEEDKT